MNTFASAGSDHSVSLWDHLSKRRVKQFATFPNAVSALAFSPDGAWLAVAYGDGLGENLDEQAFRERKEGGERGIVLKREEKDWRPKPRG